MAQRSWRTNSECEHPLIPWIPQLPANTHTHTHVQTDNFLPRLAHALILSTTYGLGFNPFLSAVQKNPKPSGVHEPLMDTCVNCGCIISNSSQLHICLLDWNPSPEDCQTATLDKYVLQVKLLITPPPTLCRRSNALRSIGSSVSRLDLPITSVWVRVWFRVTKNGSSGEKARPHFKRAVIKGQKQHKRVRSGGQIGVGRQSGEFILNYQREQKGVSSLLFFMGACMSMHLPLSAALVLCFPHYRSYHVSMCWQAGTTSGFHEGSGRAESSQVQHRRY